MGAVSSLVTGAYGTMCKCFSIGLLLSRSLFCRAILEIFRNSGKLLLLPYTKGFGRITHFLGNDLATVLYTAFCLDLLFKQLVGYKCTKDIGTIIQKREKASTLL